MAFSRRIIRTASLKRFLPSLAATLWLLLIPAASVNAVAADNAEEEVKIAVLAIRGVPEARDMWVPTAKYLSDAIPGYRFTIEPVSIDSIDSAIADGKISFVITNPASYVRLETDFGISRIATLRNRRHGGSYTEFGALIITRADRTDINTLKDLKGKSFMAVHPRAFGGWWMAWSKLLHSGIDPKKDFSRLEFSGFPQDKIVMAVKNGKVDAGTIRTDLLERMAASGLIKFEDFRVLDPQTTPGFPFAHSTRLYPEWPFAVTKNTSKTMAQHVAIALLGMSADSPASRASKSEGWTVPQDYQRVHELMKELHVGPYARKGNIAVGEVVDQYSFSIVTIILVLGMLLLGNILIIKFNRKLTKSKLALEKEVQERLRAESDQQKQVERIRTLYEVSSIPGLSLEQQIDEILKLGCRTLKMEVGKISLINREENTNTVVNMVVPGSLEIKPGNTWNLDGTFCSLLDSRGTNILALNHISSSKYNSHKAHKLSGIESYIGVPILVSDDKYWTISFASPIPHEPFPDTDIDIIKLMGRWISVILEREQVENELQKAKEISETANQIKNNFLANMSHELRTPLNAIIGYSELLKEETDADGQKQYSEDLNKIHSSGTHLLSLINGILDISKIEADKMEVFYDPINLEDVLQDIAGTLQPAIRKNKNKLTIHHPDNSGSFVTDYAKFRQILLNLINNANKFTHGGEINVNGKIENRNGTDYVIVDIHDTGIGIEPENIKELFKDFSQIDQSRNRKFEGTGLGLAISQRFCKLLGGEITAESTPGKGSVFTLILPNETARDNENDGIVLFSARD